ncbi:MAG: hypothetical protein IJK77_09185 [Lachnospiraceae bacterium]|nr:hypothetical protein [Lachnospiraceae bacterium]
MKNKMTKAAVILAAILAVLLLTAFIFVVVRGGKLAGIFDFDRILHRETTQAETTEAPEPTEENTPAESTGEVPATETETEPESTEIPPEQLRKTLNIGADNLEGNFIQLYAKADGDKIVNKLTQVSLLTIDRNGRVLYHAGNSETSEYNGTNYVYRGIADISVDYDKESDITTYTIELRKDLYFSDGTPLTADDLVFNYYIRLQPDYDGVGNLRRYDIVGLRNYYYNNSMAEEQTVSSKEIDDELAKPSETTAEFIRNLISEVLIHGAEEAEKLWSIYQSYGYGNNAQEFFYNTYGLDKNYNLVNKDMATVCKDVAASYGLDYRKLAENYAVDETYFDEKVRGFVKETLLFKKTSEAVSEPVDHISGIIRLGDRILKLKVHGYDENAVYDLLDIDVLPLHYYGDLSLYDYNAHRFGFIPGKFSIDEEKLAHPLGAGPYVYDSGSFDSVTFTRNERFYQGEPGAEFVNLRCVSGEGLGYVSEGVVDVVAVAGNKTNYETICRQNENNDLIGNALVAHDVNVLGYAYIGINANTVNVGGDPDSEASRNLRKGLATALSAFRSEAYKEYFGNSISLIEYPVSEFYGLAPQKGDPAYETAYNKDPDGNPIYSADAGTLDRYNAVIDVVRKYFELAGYTFDSEGRLKEAPKDAPVLFGISICSDEDSFSGFPSFEVLTYAKSVLHELGLSLDIRYVPDEENMLVSLYTGTSDLWFASWYTGADPEFAEHYQGKGRSDDMVPNIYGIKDDELDECLAELKKTTDPAEKTSLSLKIMNIVKEWAVEVPCYQLYNYYVYNAQTLKVESIPKELTAYHSWLDEIIHVEVGNRE